MQPKFAASVAALASAFALAPVHGAVNFYTSSADYFAALATGLSPGGEALAIGKSYDFEDFDLGTVLNGPSQPLSPGQIDVIDAAGDVLVGVDAVVNNVYNKFDTRSLEASQGGSGSDNFFLAGQALIVGTGDSSTNAFSVYINIGPSSVNQLFLNYNDPLGTDSATFYGGSGSYDIDTFYFLGVIADRGNTAFSFGALNNAVTGYNVDNINVQAVPEVTSSLLLLAGLGALGVAVRRRRG